MRLSKEDVQLFYKLYPALLVYVNSNKNIFKQVSTSDELMALPPNERVKVRDQLYKNIEFIDTFSTDNPFAFSSEELEIVQNWKNYIRGRFYLFSHLKKYSVFLNSSSPPMAYGVLSISDSSSVPTLIK